MSRYAATTCSALVIIGGQITTHCLVSFPDLAEKAIGVIPLTEDEVVNLEFEYFFWLPQWWHAMYQCNRHGIHDR